MAKNDLQLQLERQLRFLRNSCAAYDNGETDEAVRIATQLRILFYDNGNSSISLVKLMGAKSTPISTSMIEMAPNTVALMGTLSQFISSVSCASDGTYKVTAEAIPYGIEALEHGRFLSIDDWWNEIAYITMNRINITRGDIIKYAAHKDGGAHVAKNLPDEIFRISNATAAVYVHPIDPASGTEEWSFNACFNFNGDLPPGGHPVSNFIYADIRQMATEVLNSQSLISLLS